MYVSQKPNDKEETSKLLHKCQYKQQKHKQSCYTDYQRGGGGGGGGAEERLLVCIYLLTDLFSMKINLQGLDILLLLLPAVTWHNLQYALTQVYATNVI